MPLLRKFKVSIRTKQQEDSNEQHKEAALKFEFLEHLNGFLSRSP